MAFKQLQKVVTITKEVYFYLFFLGTIACKEPVCRGGTQEKNIEMYFDRLMVSSSGNKKMTIILESRICSFIFFYPDLQLMHKM